MPSSSKQKHTARNIAIVAVILVVAIAAAGFSMYASAKAAIADARTLQGQVGTLSTQVLAGKQKAARQTVDSMGKTAADLHAQMSNPLWSVLALVPVYGSDVRTVQGLASVADDLANNALVPLAGKAPSLGAGAFVKRDGTIVLKKVQPLAEALGEVAPVLERSNGTVSGLPQAHVGQVQSAVSTLQQTLPSLSRVAKAASSVKSELPDLLGYNGTRRYLLAAQNNVEMRSVGGFPGSVGYLTIHRGKVELGDFKALSAYMPRLDRGSGKSKWAKITKRERKIFSKRMAYIPGDVGQIPDFSRVGSIWAQQWSRHNSGRLDGIVAVDPVFLQSMLGLTGGITASNGWKVDGSNAAEVLMNRSYKEMPLSQTDAFFSDVAKKAFDKVVDNLGTVSFTKLVETAASQARAGRVHVWMKDAGEERAMKTLGLSGSLKSSGSARSELGIYVSDYAWSKLGWYLDEDVTVGKARAGANGTTAYDVTVKFKNTMSKAEQKKGNWYIFGNNARAKRSKGDMVYFLYLVAPAGGSITGVDADGYFGPYSTVNKGSALDGAGNDRTMAKTSYEGREVWGGETQIEPGKQTTLRFTVTVPAGAQGGLRVAGTPSANPKLAWGAGE